MIVAVAVVPAAPALIPELMGEAAPEVEPVRAAARDAMAQVARQLAGHGGRPPVGRLVVVGAAPETDEARPRSHDLAGPVADDTFGPLLELAALPGAPAPPAPDLTPWTSDGVPSPLLVGRRLVADAVDADPTSGVVWAEALWVTLRPEAVVDYARTLVRDDAPVGLVLVADGAACHGPKAPRAEDARAESYDDAVCRALASAAPADFAALDPVLGRQLNAEGAGLWPLLAAAADDGHGRGDGWRAELGWRGAPYGVGWFVATWLR